MADRFNILIVDPDTKSRGQLKQVALSLTTFDKVFTLTTLDEAFRRTGAGDHVDIIALSHRFSREEVSYFIADARKTPVGAEWAYMAILENSSKQNQTLAEGMLEGFDGFLFEPYSADNLREIAEITAKVKFRNARSRMKAALTMLIQELAGHLSASAFVRSSGREMGLPWKRFNECCAKLNRHVAEDPQLYLDVMEEVFQKADPLTSAAYRGASSRLKEKLDARIFKQLEERYRG